MTLSDLFSGGVNKIYCKNGRGGVACRTCLTWLVWQSNKSKQDAVRDNGKDL